MIECVKIRLNFQKKFYRYVFPFVALLSVHALPVWAGSEGDFRNKLISLGTASASGSFYPIGSKICELVNEERKTSLLRCVAYRTVGAEYNPKAVSHGELTMGMTGSDIAYAESMVKNTDANPDNDLRAVMSLYATPVLIISRREAKISDTSQLAGHTINFGNRGSGQRTIVEGLLKNLGLKESDFSSVSQLGTAQVTDAFCKGKVDIVVQALGNGAPFYRRLIEECGGRIVPISESLVSKVIAANPLMTRLSIPGGTYFGHPDSIVSFGYKAMLVTRKNVSDESVSRFVSIIMSKLDELKKFDPALRDLNPDDMFKDGITIPLHSGVLQYLKTRSLVLPYAD